MRKQSAYARKRDRAHHDRLAPLRLLDSARPYDEGDLLEEHIKTRAAFGALRDGTGTRDDFDRLALVLNVAVIRAEQIDEALVAVVRKTVRAGACAWALTPTGYRPCRPRSTQTRP